MRRVALVVLTALVVVTSAAGARSKDDDPRHLALQTMKVDLTAASSAETYAFKSFHSGDIAQGRHWLAEADRALEGMENAARYLTVPSAEDQVFPDSSWGTVTKNLNDALTWDKKAGNPSVGEKSRLGYLGDANVRKKNLLSLVTGELEHPMCTEVIDLRGPVMVNGVPQGPSTLTVDTNCRKPVDSIYLDIPLDVIKTFAASGTATATVEAGGHALKVDLHGGTSGEVSVQTSPDASTGQMMYEDVVPIHGSDEYFPETM